MSNISKIKRARILLKNLSSFSIHERVIYFKLLENIGKDGFEWIDEVFIRFYKLEKFDEIKDHSQLIKNLIRIFPKADAENFLRIIVNCRNIKGIEHYIKRLHDAKISDSLDYVWAELVFIEKYKDNIAEVQLLVLGKHGRLVEGPDILFKDGRLVELKFYTSSDYGYQDWIKNAAEDNADQIYRRLRDFPNNPVELVYFESMHNNFKKEFLAALKRKLGEDLYKQVIRNKTFILTENWLENLSKVP